ncbi:hypothetical protein [Pseudoclavibacter helvolus]|uniref:hypothetical protein n=1 Tax=Pseudoclavibacter helvolus TaxID=255205 RepID=UPI003736628F
MDELTLFLSTRNDALTPSTEALTAGRAALLNRASEERSAASPAARKRRLLPRLTWAAAGLTAAMGGVFVAGSVGLGAQSAQASELLQTTAAQTAQYTDLVPGAGEYLLSSTHARWSTCGTTGTEETPGEPVCTPNDQFIDVYMPADPTGLWVLDRDWGNAPIPDGIPEGPIRAENAAFYGPTSSWSLVDYSEIPLEGAATYEWIDSQYAGGSASRDEDNFVRIADILRTGLVPAPQRAALLDALALIPGVTSTENVANLDGVTGVAIGRNEPLRFGDRKEIIIDPSNGLVIGERTLSGVALFGWGSNNETELTAIRTTVASTAP